MHLYPTHSHVRVFFSSSVLANCEPSWGVSIEDTVWSMLEDDGSRFPVKTQSQLSHTNAKHAKAHNTGPPPCEFADFPLNGLKTGDGFIGL